MFLTLFCPSPTSFFAAHNLSYISNICDCNLCSIEFGRDACGSVSEKGRRIYDSMERGTWRMMMSEPARKVTVAIRTIGVRT